jgi:hypothetical protein
VQAYEGYIEKGQIFPLEPVISIPGRRRVIITVLDEPTHERADTWGELDKIVASMNEKPQFMDFPRSLSDRAPIDFDEV